MLNRIKYNLKRQLKRFLPGAVLDAVRTPFDRIESAKRANRRWSASVVTSADIAHDLLEAGIKPGDTIMVHSSLSRIGNVEGGAEAVIEALLNAVTDDGTVIMPCYNSADSVFRDLKRDELIDLRKSTSATGKISEVFRTWPGVTRSSHPFSSACAWGKMAEYITRDHASDPNVCHTQSPVGRLIELKGRVIGIGIPLAQGLGVAHCLEDTWDGFPFDVHTTPCAVAYIDSQGEKINREVCRYDPKVARTRIDYPEGAWIGKKLTAHLKARAIMKPFRCGHANSWIMEAADLFEELKRLASKNVTMYLTENRLTAQNRDVENW